MGEDRSGKSFFVLVGIPAIGVVLFLLVAWIADFLVDREALEGALVLQQDWIDAVSKTSTLELAQTFWREASAVASGASPNPEYYDAFRPEGNVLLAPIAGLGATLAQYFSGGGLTALVQLALGALCVLTFNYVRSGRRKAVFDTFIANITLIPILIILAGSVIGLVLQWLMIGALNAFGGVASLAAYAMGLGGMATTTYACCVHVGGDRLQDAIAVTFGLKPKL